MIPLYVGGRGSTRSRVLAMASKLVVNIFHAVLLQKTLKAISRVSLGVAH